jgi:superfamily II DNA or RNA helicase
VNTTDAAPPDGAGTGAGCLDEVFGPGGCAGREPRFARARVAGTITLSGADILPRVLERLRRDLSFPNPEFVSRKRLGRWLGATPERIECLVEKPDGTILLPRGAVQKLRERLADAGLAVRFEDNRVVGAALPKLPAIDLRPYQREAVAAIRRCTQGTVVMPCGGGKTMVGAAAIAEIGREALVIVHTRDLLEQWRSVLRERLGIDAGVVTEGVSHPGPVTVATVQTLVRLDQTDFEHLAERAGLVIVDEAHHAPAVTFQSVLSRLPGRWRVGLTATPVREDGLGPLLDLTLGYRIFEVGYAELVADGFLQAPAVQALFTGFTFDYRGPEDHAACLAALVADEKRNAAVADLAAREAAQGRTVLVLSGRVDHCRALADLVRSRGTQAEVLVGATPKAERNDILERFRSGEVNVVVASTLADEGLDVPRLDRIVLAFPGRAAGRTTQRLGRLMRPHPGKAQPVLWDVVDCLVPPLRAQYAARRRLYADLLGASAPSPLGYLQPLDTARESALPCAASRALMALTQAGLTPGEGTTRKEEPRWP